MGESIDRGLKFVDTMSEIYGMDPSNIYRHAGYFYQLTEAIGMTDDASATLSLSLTKASNDIASLFNVDIETVVNNIASGMQGMSRAVRKYGMDIRAVTLQQTALSYGITEQVENMSEADRMALRYLTMMKQVKNATSQVVDETYQASGVMGDFARNIETPANQLRVFREQVSQLGRAIGNFFIPALSKLLPVLNGLVMAIRTVLTFLSALTGFNLNFGGASSGADKTADAIGGIGDAANGASKAAKELRKNLAPFDELNILQAPKESSGGAGGGISDELLDPALAAAIEEMSLGLEDIEMKANKVRDSLLRFFGFDYVEEFNPETGEFEKKLKWFADQFETNLINKFPQWSKTITALFDNWGDIINSVKGLFASIGSVIDSVKTKVIAFVDSLNLDEKFSNAISNLSGNLDSLSSWISSHKDQIADFIILVGKVAGAFKVFQIITRYVKPLVTVSTTLVRFAAVVGPLLELVAPILAVAGAIALLATNSEAFADSSKGLLSAVTESFGPIVESISTFVERIWSSLQSLWTEALQPLVGSIGDALAPIITTFTVLWNTLSQIFQSIMDLLGTLWEVVIAPIIAAISGALQALMNIIRQVWSQVIGPVINHILESLPELFDTIKPIIENVGAILAGLIELVLSLWTNVLAPLISWIIEDFGPGIRNTVNNAWDVISTIAKSIAGVINGLLTILRGLIDFLVGVFTGDWSRAWQGIKEIFAGIWNSLSKIVETVLNAIISAVNGVISILWGTLQAFVNGILDTVNNVAGLLGFDISLNWGSPPPAIGYVTLPTVGYANGGFPEDGLFMANHSELVGQFSNGKTAVANNEQITTGIANATYDAFMRAMSDSGFKGNSSKNNVVTLNVNGREFMRAVYGDYKAVAVERGMSFVTGG